MKERRKMLVRELMTESSLWTFKGNNSLIANNVIIKFQLLYLSCSSKVQRVNEFVSVRSSSFNPYPFQF